LTTATDFGAPRSPAVCQTRVKFWSWKAPRLQSKVMPERLLERRIK
jgi:hypothetical protein